MRMYQNNILSLIGKKVKHKNNASLLMTIIKVHGNNVVTCLMEEQDWYKIYQRTLIDRQICLLENLIPA